MAQYTLRFADRGEGSGWTDFVTYYPELTLALGNRFYSLQDGQLWEHNDNSNPTRNEIYDRGLVSKITTVLNAENAEDKIFKNLILEGNEAWSVVMKTNLSTTTLAKDEFNARESKWFAHLRQNETIDNLKDRTQGIGNILGITGTSVRFKSLPTLVSVGESLYQLRNGSEELVGEISEIGENTIKVASIVNTPSVGNFCFSVKNARIQGAEIRGYFAEVTLSTNSKNAAELYAIGSNVALSYVRAQMP
jgi:hypothetical protein